MHLPFALFLRCDRRYSSIESIFPVLPLAGPARSNERMTASENREGPGAALLAVMLRPIVGGR